MHKRSCFVLIMVICVSSLFSQDTVRIRRSPDDGRYCTLVICAKKNCFSDTVPEAILGIDAKLELRINDNCSVKKAADVFVSSFEVSSGQGTERRSSVAQSSFVTDAQLQIIRYLKKGDAFTVSNVMLHAPDGFKKMEDLQLIIK